MTYTQKVEILCLVSSSATEANYDKADERTNCQSAWETPPHYLAKLTHCDKSADDLEYKIMKGRAPQRALIVFYSV